MAFVITNRAFRFNVGNRNFAIDIFSDGIVYDAVIVHLLEDKPDGWNRLHHEMEPPLTINQSAVDTAGGIVQLCQLIVEKINKALRIAFGAAEGEDLPPPANIHEQVMDHLRTHLRVEYVNDVPQLVLN